MTTSAPILELPLHLVGVSDEVSDWLKQAGVPVVRLGQEYLQSTKPSNMSKRQRKPNAVRCVLFDSRDPLSRSVAKNPQFPGAFKIDIAAWVASKSTNAFKVFKKVPLPQQPARLDFLERLKKAIESEGGIWARLADFPFPYQGVVCLNGDWPHEFVPPEMLPLDTHRLEAISKRYNAGLPSMISVSDLSGLADLPPVSGLQSRGLPLLWRTKPTEFTKWWLERNDIEVKLWQTAKHYHVDCQIKNSAFCPVLEIWRGTHLASIPLRSKSIVVQKDGLVFQHQPARHPAGFTAGWPDRSRQAASTRLSA